MNHKVRLLSLVFLVSIAVEPLAKADEMNHKTRVTLSSPIAVRGALLPAGLYVFKLPESQMNRDIAQILNEDQTHIEATILAAPSYHRALEERPKRSGRKWFFVGQLDGVKLVYDR